MSNKFVRYSQSLAKKPKKQTLFLNCDGADVSFFVLLLFIKLIGTLMKIVPVFLTNKLLKIHTGVFYSWGKIREN